MRNQLKIDIENEYILKIITKAKPSYGRSDWHNHFEKVYLYLRISKDYTKHFIDQQ